VQQKNGQLRVVEDGEFGHPSLLRWVRGGNADVGVATVLRQKVMSEHTGGGNGEGRAVEAAAG